ncbi:hypothetical protein ACC738_38220, partial [Rhizobium ruizarguesonis]
IRQAIVRSSAELTDIRTIEVPAFDPAALVAVLEGLSREKPCGIALVATDAPDVRAAFDRLVRKIGKFIGYDSGEALQPLAMVA